MTVGPTFTIGVLVTQPALYKAMRDSFEAGGFDQGVEWLTIDNTGPKQTDAFQGLNQILSRAMGTYVLLCHQDLLLLDHDRSVLEARLEDLGARDPHWAVAGNAGGADVRQIVQRVTNRNDIDMSKGDVPQRVYTLDENFIVVRSAARVAFSNDLNGFHLYGTDICLVADLLGYSSWVIDFHLKHYGEGTMGAEFERCEAAFRRKWQTALRDRQLQTPCTYMSLSGRRRPKIFVASREQLDRQFALARRQVAKLLRKPS